MSKQSEPYFITDPRTKKNLSVSRDVYHALQYANEKAKTHQSTVSDSITAVTKVLTKKSYKGEAKDMKIAVKFNDRGQIDEFADPKVELANSLNTLPPQVKAEVEKAIEQFMICINQALAEKANDMETKLKEQISGNSPE
jgi:hypothetical protein